MQLIFYTLPTLEAWLKDKGQKVVFGEDNRPVRIVCTDFRCEDEDAPVLACVDCGGYERDYCFTTEGTVRKGVHSSESDLFLLTDEPETPPSLIEQLMAHLAGLSHEEKMKEWEEICALCTDELEECNGKRDGSNAPTWDEKNGGVYVPILNITIQAKNLLDEDGDPYHDWKKAKQLAEAAGGRLFTKDEAHILLFQKDAINALLKDHDGDLLDGIFWSSSEYNEAIAWTVHFSSGSVGGSSKSYSVVARAVVRRHQGF